MSAASPLRPGQAGGLARARSFTPASQRRARLAHTHENLSAWGRKGYEALVRERGLDYALGRAADWRRKHPTALEQIVSGWLEAAHESYEAEARVDDCLYVDFLLATRRLVIECDGAPWHRNSGPHGEDREGRDRTKDERVRALGYRVLRLTEAEILSGAGQDRLAAAIRETL